MYLLRAAPRCTPPPISPFSTPIGDQCCINSLSLKRRKSGKHKDCFCKSKIQENRSFSLWRTIFRETCFLDIINAFYIFLRSANGRLGFSIITEPVLTLKSGEREQLISLGLKTTFWCRAWKWHILGDWVIVSSCKLRTE